MSERLIKGASRRPRTIGNAALHKEICIFAKKVLFISFGFALSLQDDGRCCVDGDGEML